MTARARQIAKLVAGHCAADPGCKWVVKMWNAPHDWSIWLWRPGVEHIFEYDHIWILHT